MNKIYKKLVNKFFMAVVLLLCVVLVNAQTINNVSYIDANGVTRTANNVTVISTGGTQTLTSGWYMLRGTQSFNGSLEINGTVHLILEDSCNWTITDGGIRVDANNNISIYAQSTSTNMGRLTANGSGFSAGIGNRGETFMHTTAGSITINGGVITANGGTTGVFGTLGSAGIGGGLYASGGTIIINGGIINALALVAHLKVMEALLQLPAA